MSTEQRLNSIYTFRNPTATNVVINFGCTSAGFNLLEPMSPINITHHGTSIIISINRARQIHISGPGIAVSFHLEGSVVKVDIMLDTEIDTIMRAMSNIDQMAGPGGLYDFTVRRSPFGSDFDSLQDKPGSFADGSFGIHNILRGLENSSPEDNRHFRHHRS